MVLRRLRGETKVTWFMVWRCDENGRRYLDGKETLILNGKVWALLVGVYTVLHVLGVVA